MTEPAPGPWVLLSASERRNAQLKSENKQLREVLRRLLDNYDEETGSIDVASEPSCKECTLGLTPAKFDKGPCARHQALAALMENHNVL